ncbi:hypothetical protein [Marinobacter sp. LV10R520-4]|uniref:hypothetical protein n=1 Tax=Marinobacter sp. LV10R520-4 TaxID=1761796 RepID=UPI0015CF111C
MKKARIILRFALSGEKTPSFASAGNNSGLGALWIEADETGRERPGLFSKPAKGAVADARGRR